MAHLSKDKNLTNAFNKGLDVHSATAAEVFGVNLEEVTQDQRRSACLLYTSPSPRDATLSRMPSSA